MTGLEHEVIEARLLGGYRLFLRFADGAMGEVDIAEIIGDFTGVFAPLRDPEEFAKVRVDQEAGTIVWPDDVDLAPETLYEAATGRPHAPL